MPYVPVCPKTYQRVKKNSKLSAEKSWLIAKTGIKYLSLIRQEICPSAWKKPFATRRNSSELKFEGNLKLSLHFFNCLRAEEIDKVSL